MSQQSPNAVAMDKAPAVSVELRARIVKDPNVAKMAEAMKMPLEDFVNAIGYFIQNPGAEPSLIGATDEALRQRGVVVPTPAKVANNIRSSVAAIDARRPRSGFAQAPATPLNLVPKLENVTREAPAELEAAVKRARTLGKM